MRHFRFQVVMVLGTALLAVFASALPVSAQVTYDTIAMVGDQAPGTASGVVFSSVSSPAINAVGQTTFFGFLSGSSVNTTGIWSGGSGSLGLIAASGNAAPGTGVGTVFQSVHSTFWCGKQLLRRCATQQRGTDRVPRFSQRHGRDHRE